MGAADAQYLWKTGHVPSFRHPALKNVASSCPHRAHFISFQRFLCFQLPYLALLKNNDQNLNLGKTGLLMKKTFVYSSGIWVLLWQCFWQLEHAAGSAKNAKQNYAAYLAKNPLHSLKNVSFQLLKFTTSRLGVLFYWSEYVFLNLHLREVKNLTG